MIPLRSRVTTVGRQAAGARALWRATGTGENEFGKPIVAIVNSYTQFVPGHVHLKEVGDIVANAVRAAGGTAILIMVSVALTTVKQIESQLLQSNYEGLLR